MFQQYFFALTGFLIKTGRARKTTLKPKDIENQSIQDLQTYSPHHGADCIYTYHYNVIRLISDTCDFLGVYVIDSLVNCANPLDRRAMFMVP